MEWQWVAIAAVFVFLVIGVRMTATMKYAMMQTTKPHSRTDEARSILENRFALGEINEEEFAHRMQVLNEERSRKRMKERQTG
jgi:uncharacterized membrane protein